MEAIRTIEQEIKLVGSKCRRDVIARFDREATYSIIRRDIAEAIESIVKFPEPSRRRAPRADGYITVEEAIRTDFYIDIYRLSDEFLVSDAITEAMIIGVLTVRKWRLEFDFEHGKAIVPRPPRLRI